MADPTSGPAWTDRPATPQEWPLARPAPSKAAFADFLTRDLAITNPSVQSGLWSAIAFSAQWLLIDELKRPDTKTLRRRLSQIEAQTDKLLETLTPPADALQQAAGPPPADDVETWLWRLLRGAEPHSADAVIANTQIQLHQLKALIAKTQATLAASGGGRRKDETLWTWVEHLSPIWALYSNRPITVDYHEGAPITPYAVFMHHAVRMLDPEREPKLPSILDRYRTQQNRAKSLPDIPE
ncbi:hypothetical protein [Hyphomonas sp.]|uniref:hypothetical protein n=1 Tax=Hyphomonas sp. TaxID=87 RepID=UPI0025BE4B29|nr:hypothetical protein [Hyphomonas sp.]